MKSPFCDILFAENKETIYYISGSTVFAERYIDGMPLPLYWSSDGQIWPDGHLNYPALQLHLDRYGAFGLGTVGGDILDWEFVEVSVGEDASGLRDALGIARECRLVYQNTREGLRVVIHTRVDGSPVVSRRIQITNISDKPIGLTKVIPFQGRIWDNCMWTVGGMEAVLPSGVPLVEVAYNHSTDACQEGDIYFEPLTHLYFDGGLNGKSGFSRPAFWLKNNHSGQTLVCEYGYSGNWCMELKNEGPETFASIGFPALPEGEMLRVLEPGEDCWTPMVHLGIFRDSHDAIIQAMHEYLYTTVLRAPVPGREIEIEANHRGYLCDKETTPAICRDVDMAAEAGVELYTIDAGWYGNPPNQWYNNVGDWFSAPWLEGGLEAVVRHVRERGMRFGLWIEIEASGSNSTLRKEHPEWSMTRYGEPVAGGRQLDWTIPEVAEWAYEQIAQTIERYELDLYRIDNNHCMGLGGTREREGMTENLVWRYYDAFYDVFARLSQQYPQVVFQNCSSGGGRHDFGVLRYFQTFEFSDCLRPPSVLRVYNGLTIALPPGLGLKVYGTECFGLANEGDLLTQLRGAFLARPILRGIAPTERAVHPHLMAEIKRYVELFRTWFRPLLKDGKMYHHTPFVPLREPAPYVTVELAAQDASRSVVCAFATSSAAKRTTVSPRGVHPAYQYRVTKDGEEITYTVSGRELMRDGVLIDCSVGRSVLYLIERV